MIKFIVQRTSPCAAIGTFNALVHVVQDMKRLTHCNMSAMRCFERDHELM